VGFGRGGPERFQTKVSCVGELLGGNYRLSGDRFERASKKTSFIAIPKDAWGLRFKI
jgi:hypothetical protein